MLLAKKTRVDINKCKRKKPKSPRNNEKDIQAAHKTIYSLSFRSCKKDTPFRPDEECDKLCENTRRVPFHLREEFQQQYRDRTNWKSKVHVEVFGALFTSKQVIKRNSLTALNKIGYNRRKSVTATLPDLTMSRISLGNRLSVQSVLVSPNNVSENNEIILATPNPPSKCQTFLKFIKRHKYLLTLWLFFIFSGITGTIIFIRMKTRSGPPQVQEDFTQNNDQDLSQMLLIFCIVFGVYTFLILLITVCLHTRILCQWREKLLKNRQEALNESSPGNRPSRKTSVISLTPRDERLLENNAIGLEINRNSEFLGPDKDFGMKSVVLIPLQTRRENIIKPAQQPNINKKICTKADCDGENCQILPEVKLNTCKNEILNLNNLTNVNIEEYEAPACNWDFVKLVKTGDNHIGEYNKKTQRCYKLVDKPVYKDKAKVVAEIKRLEKLLRDGKN